jgi:hypothetical protein
MSGWGPPGGGGYGPPGQGGFGPPPGMAAPPGPGGPMGPGMYAPMGMVPGGMGGGPDPMATGKLAAPAITIMVTTALGMLFGLFSIVVNILGVAVAPEGQDQVAQFMSGGIGIMTSLLGLGCGAFALYALNNMRQAKGWGMSLAAVIMSMVPCFGPCWCLNLFIGIWALFVLNDAAVKASFQG